MGSDYQTIEEVGRTLNLERVEDFVELLDEALNNLTVKSVGSSGPLETAEYRRRVRLCATSYAPTLYLNSFLYIPDIADDRLKEQALSLIRTNWMNAVINVRSSRRPVML